MADLVGRDEGDERLRPTERTVQPCLVRVPTRFDDPSVTDVKGYLPYYCPAW